MGIRQGTCSKNDLGTQHTEILPSVNGRLVRLHGFTPAEIILGFVPEWRITNTHRDTPGVPLGFIEEALQEDIDEMEEGPEGLRIERLLDRRNERRTLAVRSISENHTRQAGKTRAQWT